MQIQSEGKSSLTLEMLNHFKQRNTRLETIELIVTGRVSYFQGRRCVLGDDPLYMVSENVVVDISIGLYMHN